MMRGAECWSDHMMVRAKLVLKLRQLIKKFRPGLKHLNMQDLKHERVRTELVKKLTNPKLDRMCIISKEIGSSGESYKRGSIASTIY